MQTKRTFVLAALTAAALERAHRRRLRRRRAKNRRRSHHADVAVLDRLQPIHRRASEGSGRRPAAAVQFRIRHGETDHGCEERDHARGQRPHLLAIRQLGRRNDSEDGGSREVKVVAVDVATETGPVAIVVRANNIAYGEKACKYIGEHVAEGPVVQIMGDQASINGRDRGNGFRDCIKKNYPKLKELEIPTKAWSGEDAAAGLDTILNSTPDLKAIYMHAGGVFLAPTLQTLKRKGMLHPAGEKAISSLSQRRNSAGI